MSVALVLPRHITDSHRLVVVHPEQTQAYERLAHFIKEAYWQRYGAQNPHLLPILVALETEQGEVVAVCGVSLGAQHPLFLEHYLDTSIEKAIYKQSGAAVGRSQIVEVGNLCSMIPSGGRLMIAALCRWFYTQGLSWVVFTGTAQLRNSFAKLGIGLCTLAKADPTRLGQAADDWGYYYQTNPAVMAGDITFNVERLLSAPMRGVKNSLPLYLDVITDDASD